MKRTILLLFFLGISGMLAYGQHYQRVVNDITSCNTWDCIDSVRQKYKPLRDFEPLKKEMGLDTYRVFYDFELGHGGKEKEAKQKSFKLSMLVHQNSIAYALLEQLNETGQTEATYLFKNDTAFLKKHVAAYNERYRTSYTYPELIRSVTSRQPIFWIGVH